MVLPVNSIGIALQLYYYLEINRHSLDEVSFGSGLSSHFVCHDVNNIDDALCEAFLWLTFAIYVQIHGIRLKLISWNKYIVFCGYIFSIDITELI